MLISLQFPIDGWSLVGRQWDLWVFCTPVGVLQDPLEPELYVVLTLG